MEGRPVRLPRGALHRSFECKCRRPVEPKTTFVVSKRSKVYVVMSFFVLYDRRIRIQRPVDEEGIVVAVGRLSSLSAIKNYFTATPRKLAISARFAPLRNSRSSTCVTKKKMSFASEKIPTGDDDA